MPDSDPKGNINQQLGVMGPGQREFQASLEGATIPWDQQMAPCKKVNQDFLVSAERKRRERDKAEIQIFLAKSPNFKTLK